MIAWDWYQATVPVDVDTLLEGLMAGSERAVLAHQRGVQGYAHCTKLQSPAGDDAGQVEVWHGGTHAYPHVRFTSDAAPGHVDVLRERFPLHYCSRVDAKEDFDGADTFDRVLPLVVQAAKRHRVKLDARGDHYLTKKGRTLTLGAASSAVRLRVYDKAAELQAKFAADPARLVQLPEHLTRFEVQLRVSDRKARAACATLEPALLMGASPFVAEAWQAFGGAPVSPFRCTSAWRASDDERTFAYLVSAFGGLLSRRAADAGSWECLGLDLRDAVAEAQRAKEELRARSAR